MLIDLHCHTLPLSTCSALSPTELIRIAAERGLGGVCLTEHDRPWPAEGLARLRAESPIAVFSAVELTTDLGHVLAFGLKSDHFSPFASEAFAAAQNSGGLLFLAHPARDGLLKITHDTVEFFSSVEAINGSDSKLKNMAASGLAKGFRLPGIAGSDAHSTVEVGRAATKFHLANLKTDSDLLEALRSGEYEAISLE
ncbi:MAG: CehA/McbA family metallohydrolase [Dehalococcoidia bacterium]